MTDTLDLFPPPPATPSAGRVVSLHASNGGLPKLEIPTARITETGIEGDRQRNLKYHGGRERALCLWSLERIEALRGEGHPVSPGSTGEGSG